MRGLYKSTGGWQTQAARDDYTYLREWATGQGHGDQAEKLQPPASWGWRKIDKRIENLTQYLRDQGLNPPPCPSNTEAFEKWEASQ